MGLVKEFLVGEWGRVGTSECLIKGLEAEDSPLGILTVDRPIELASKLNPTRNI
jgi:hypothetical protein